MPEAQYQYLAEAEWREALQAASLLSGRRTQLLEKDIWVVATMDVLFQAPFGHHLVFKGGTSLSKVWRAIRWFSEDIDITYDIRGFAPDLGGGLRRGGAASLAQPREVLDAGDPPAPRRMGARHSTPTRQEGTRPSWFRRAGFERRLRQLYVACDPMFAPVGPVRPEVRVDFGARSTGDPHIVRPIVSTPPRCCPISGSRKPGRP